MIPRRISLFGSGPAVQALVPQLAQSPGVISVRQTTTLTSEALEADLVIEATGGLALGYDVAMGALRHGAKLIITTPVLAAVHGPMLAAAAAGQGSVLGLSAAGVGPLANHLASYQPHTVLFMPQGAGQSLLTRLLARNESAMAAESDLLRHASTEFDLSDLQGKVTAARAQGLYLQWQGHPQQFGASRHQPPAPVRMGLDALHGSTLAHLQKQGITIKLLAKLTAQSILVGPMALPSEHPWAHQRPTSQADQEGLEWHTASSTPTALSLSASWPERLHAGIMHDVKVASQGTRPTAQARKTAPKEETAPAQSYLAIIPADQRARLSAHANAIQHEAPFAPGQWRLTTTMLPGKLQSLVPAALIFPIAYQEVTKATPTHLRLVG
jgi:hypothetical protein